MSSNYNSVTPNPGANGQKSDNSSSKNDDLTVLVFKDNSVARTFKVPLGWISRLGLIVGIVTAVAVLGIFLSTRFYFLARQASKSGDPSYVQALESENSDLKTNLKQAQTATAVQTTAVGPAPAPAPTVTVTVTATPAAVAPPPAAEPAQPLVMSMAAGPGFTALPSNIIPAFTDSPISIYEPKVKWAGRSSSATLKVQFFIQYTREDKGNQQGRIILLARGPQTVVSYPPGVLNGPDNSSLIAPDNGEYFSVSHVREVKTDFGPFKSSKEITSVEVFLVSADQKLLVHQILKPETQIIPVAPVRKAAPVATPIAVPVEKPKTDDNAPSGTGEEHSTPQTAATTAAPAVAPTTATTPTQAAPNPSNLPGDL